MNFKLLFITSGLLLVNLFSCTDDPKAEAEALAKKWCSCNEGLIPLHTQLNAAESPQQRKNVLDSMHTVVAQNMECLGGEKKWVKKDQEMTDPQKNVFLKTFRRVKEEECPEIFKLIAELEASIQAD